MLKISVDFHSTYCLKVEQKREGEKSASKKREREKREGKFETSFQNLILFLNKTKKKPYGMLST